MAQRLTRYVCARKKRYLQPRHTPRREQESCKCAEVKMKIRKSDAQLWCKTYDAVRPRAARCPHPPCCCAQNGGTRSAYKKRCLRENQCAASFSDAAAASHSASQSRIQLHARVTPRRCPLPHYVHIFCQEMLHVAVAVCLYAEDRACREPPQSARSAAGYGSTIPRCYGARWWRSAVRWFSRDMSRRTPRAFATPRRSNINDMDSSPAASQPIHLRATICFRLLSPRPLLFVASIFMPRCDARRCFHRLYFLRLRPPASPLSPGCRRLLTPAEAPHATRYDSQRIFSLAPRAARRHIRLTFIFSATVQREP